MSPWSALGELDRRAPVPVLGVPRRVAVHRGKEFAREGPERLENHPRSEAKADHADAIGAACLELGNRLCHDREHVRVGLEREKEREQPRVARLTVIAVALACARLRVR
eukprot:Amastigsp_a678035_21.p3 type:complete len:109 gc:universal Amastigsp_a678035_21:583-257(-)